MKQLHRILAAIGIVLPAPVVLVLSILFMDWPTAQEAALEHVALLLVPWSVPWIVTCAASVIGSAGFLWWSRPSAKQQRALGQIASSCLSLFFSARAIWDLVQSSL